METARNYIKLNGDALLNSGTKNDLVQNLKPTDACGVSLIGLLDKHPSTQKIKDLTFGESSYSVGFNAFDNRSMTLSALMPKTDEVDAEAEEDSEDKPKTNPK